MLIGEMCVSQWHKRACCSFLQEQWHKRACCSFLQEQRSLKAGEITQQESQNMSASSMKLQTETFTAEKVNPRGICAII